MSRDLILVLIALFAWGLGEGMFLIFQPLYLEQLGADPVGIGGVMGLWAASMAISHIPAGYLADRFGRRPLMWAGWSLGAAASYLMALAGSLPIYIAGMLLYGLTAFTLSPINSYVTAARRRLSVGQVITLVSAVFHAGAIIGPRLGGAIAGQFGLRYIYWASAVIFTISTLMVLLLRPQAVEPQPPGEKRPGLVLNSRFNLYLGMVFLVIFAAYLPQPLTPNFLEKYHALTYDKIGWLGSIGSLGVVVFNLIFGQFRPRLGFLLGQAAVGVFALIMWQGAGQPLFMLAYFMLGGYRAARALAIAQSGEMAPAANMGLAYGLVETVGAFAMIGAPILAGFLYQRDPYLVYMTGIGLLLAAMLASTLFLFRKEPVKSVTPR
jgi:MFS family permease